MYLRVDDCLTAAMLGIKEWEVEGLVDFVNISHRMKHNVSPVALDHEVADAESIRDRDYVFNMTLGCMSAECGTVACIGGFVGILAHIDWSKYEVSHYVHTVSWDRSYPLHDLYYPNDGRMFELWGSYTPIGAAKVVTHFLKTARVNWQLAKEDIDVEQDITSGGTSEADALASLVKEEASV